MRKITLLSLLVFMVSLSSFGQQRWAAITANLNQKFETNEISGEEWVSGLRKQAGYLGPLKLWFKSEVAIVKTTNPSLKLLFNTEFQEVMPNGNKYAKVELINNTSDSVTIERIDATVANVQEYFFINRKWVSFRQNHTSTCGNSYYRNTLAPYHKINLQLENNDLTDGENKVKYKISITLGGQLVISNVIVVKMHDNQIARVLEGKHPLDSF